MLKFSYPNPSEAFPWSEFQKAKAERRANFFKYVYGWKKRKCSACNGSGYYDARNSPKCGGCEGTGKESYPGPKSAKPEESW